MGNYNSLKAIINANIKENGNREITGAVMNSVLNAMVNSLGTGYQYAGVATPATNPGTPDYKCFYLAATTGTYTNFGGIVVANDEVAVLKWDTTWHKEVTGAYRKPSAGIPKADLNNSVQSMLDKANVALTAINDAIKNASSPLYIDLDTAPSTFLISGANTAAWAYIVKYDDMGNTHTPEITLLAGDDVLSFVVGNDDNGDTILRMSSANANYTIVIFTSLTSVKPEFCTPEGGFQDATPVSVKVPYVKPSTGIPASDLVGLKKFYLSEAEQGYCFDPLAQYDTYLELFNHDTTAQKPSWAAETINSRIENNKFFLSVQLKNLVRQNYSESDNYYPIAIAGMQFANMKSGNCLPIYYSQHLSVNPSTGAIKGKDFVFGTPAGDVSLSEAMNGASKQIRSLTRRSDSVRVIAGRRIPNNNFGPIGTIRFSKSPTFFMKDAANGQDVASPVLARLLELGIVSLPTTWEQNQDGTFSTQDNKRHCVCEIIDGNAIKKIGENDYTAVNISSAKTQTDNLIIENGRIVCVQPPTIRFEGYDSTAGVQFSIATHSLLYYRKTGRCVRTTSGGRPSSNRRKWLCCHRRKEMCHSKRPHRAIVKGGSGPIYLKVNSLNLNFYSNRRMQLHVKVRSIYRKRWVSTLEGELREKKMRPA